MNKVTRAILWIVLAVAAYALGFATYRWLFPRDYSVQQAAPPSLSN